MRNILEVKMLLFHEWKEQQIAKEWVVEDGVKVRYVQDKFWYYKQYGNYCNKWRKQHESGN